MLDALGRVLPLALVDTVSMSTLAVPVWFLLVPGRLRGRNVFGYLVVVGAAYLALGVALAHLLPAVRDALTAFLATTTGDLVLAFLGILLMLGAAAYGLGGRPGRQPEGRLSRWRDRAVGPEATARGVLIVAAVAVLAEVVTMVPYLTAIEILADRPAPERALVLAVYCLVMIVPAALLTVLRLVAENTVRPLLRRADGWLRDNARENTAWLLAFGGFTLLYHTEWFRRTVAPLYGDT